jgi:hypothetical protein
MHNSCLVRQILRHDLSQYLFLGNGNKLSELGSQREIYLPYFQKQF